MSHVLGRIVTDDRTFDETTGLDFVPVPGTLGGPRFVMLHFDNVSLSPNARLTVDLGYGTDVFNASSGSNFWSRPVDGSLSPIPIRITGGTGSARLHEHGSGEPSQTADDPGDPCGSRSNPDPFLHTDPYEEPIFETRLKCNPDFAWQNAACALGTVPAAVKDRVAAAVGIIVVTHHGHVSSCSGTLIAADLFLTARHCLNDPTGEDVRSASVTFGYATDCDGRRPPGHTARFFKVLGEVASGTPPTPDEPPSAVDWVVVRLNAAPGDLPAPLEMRDAALMTGEVIFTMHHPNGAVKKTQAGVHGGGPSIVGFDYAGGSSGSALFDVNGRLVQGPLSRGGSCFAPGACGVTYAPLAPIKAALTSPPAPPVPLDVMLVFDRSGSMAASAPPIGRTKLDEAQDAAALFVQLVREGAGDRLGLVTFSSIASLDAPLGLAATAKPVLVGPPPFTGGDIGAISAGGSTSIGAGVGAAILTMGSGPNDRAILLLSDGLQNTEPLIEEIERFLGSIKLCVIGFGSDAEIDGPLLSRIAREHGGDFTRAVDGLALRKFFGLCFGNIFETGALGDPEFVLGARQAESAPHQFFVCGEERVTLVLGWDDPSTPLRARIRTPSGKLINEKRIETARGRTWVFWRIALPHNGERDGTWQFVVDRLPVGGEFPAPPPPTDVRYFFLIVSAGGPKLAQLGGPRRVYTGDPIDAMVGLHYSNGTAPPAEVELTVDVPTIALGQLVMEAGLRRPVTSPDTVGAFHATLQAVQRQAGGVLPVPRSTIRVPLFDDGGHDDGAMEPDGVYNNRLSDLTRTEGTYHFRAVATYGEGCRATRDAAWSIHVEPGIDPGRSDVTVVDVTDRPDGRHGTLVIDPRDVYGNPLGPGRGDRFTVSPMPGVSVVGGVKDLGDGSYGVSVVWDGSVTPVPGCVITQPDRNPVTMTPPKPTVPPEKHCTEAAESLLDCLGLDDVDVKRVRVKSVSLEIDLKDTKDRKERDC
jgi:hypothetical protein